MAARAGRVARDVHEEVGSGGAAAAEGDLIPHGEEARSAVSNHESPNAAILRDAASRLLRMRTSRLPESYSEPPRSAPPRCSHRTAVNSCPTDRAAGRPRR